MNKHNLSTSNFRENGIFVFKLFVLFGIVCAFWLHIFPQHLGEYQAALIDKVERLENIEEPKIVLIGNSNWVYGIDSEVLEEAFDMPVVNMGLHGGLGNAFHERMAKLNVTKGDIYIVCQTLYWDDGSIINPDLAWITIEDHFSLYRLLEPEDYLPMLRAFPAYLKDSMCLWAEGAPGNLEIETTQYARAAFNEYGDTKWVDHGLEYEFREGEITVPVISDDECRRLNELYAFLQERGATMLISGYPIAETESMPELIYYGEAQVDFEQKLDAPIISKFTDYIFDENLFFDQNWHLNSEGRKLRTDQLILDLEKYFSSLGSTEG